jgi:hypothetical protein
MGLSGYIWIALLLKVPAVGFAYVVWRTLRGDRDVAGEPKAAPDDGGGGSKLALGPHPRPRVPRPPRRGPHGAAPIPAPARVRSVVSARARAGAR